MDDSFSYGGRKKKHRSSIRPRRPRRSEPDPPPKHAASRRTLSVDGRRLAFGAIGLGLAAVSIWGFLQLDGSDTSGDGPGSGTPVGSTADIQAKQTAASAVEMVQTLYTSEGSFATVTPRELRASGSEAHYSPRASTGADTVSVASTVEGVGIAVRSSSGTCFYAHVIPSGIAYGTGSPCTGEAALKAAAPAWPSQST
jgi:hypothetical protein